MRSETFQEIQAWLVAEALRGASETELMGAFCERCKAAGLPISRAIMFIDTLHPIFEGRGVRWRDDAEEDAEIFEYGRTGEGEASSSWQRTPFHAMDLTGANELRIRLKPETEIASTMVSGLRDAGHTDYIAFVHRFDRATSFGEVDCVYSHFATRRAEEFSEADIDALRRLVPLLALGFKAGGYARIARTLAHVYLGKRAGDRVLAGSIGRGMAERINAVLWFSDLHSYTSISDAEPSDVIPFLNDYANAVITAVQGAGGDVLKLMGDGVLAIFSDPDPRLAATAALAAAKALRNQLIAINVRRLERNETVTTAYVGLHLGEVFFGNIGSEDRLDFTVVGPAVNEVSRICSMCRSVDRDILISDALFDVLDEERKARFVSTGRFALRGVSRARTLYTIDPEASSR